MIPEHMMDALNLYVSHGVLPGHFLQAVLSNDLVGAFEHSDHVNTVFMREYVNWLYNEAPSCSWGSREKVRAWHNIKWSQRESAGADALLLEDLKKESEQ